MKASFGKSLLVTALAANCVPLPLVATPLTPNISYISRLPVAKIDHCETSRSTSHFDLRAVSKHFHLCLVIPEKKAFVSLIGQWLRQLEPRSRQPRFFSSHFSPRTQVSVHRFVFCTSPLSPAFHVRLQLHTAPNRIALPKFSIATRGPRRCGSLIIFCASANCL